MHRTYSGPTVGYLDLWEKATVDLKEVLSGFHVRHLTIRARRVEQLPMALSYCAGARAGGSPATALKYAGGKIGQVKSVHALRKTALEPEVRARSERGQQSTKSAF